MQLVLVAACVAAAFAAIPTDYCDEPYECKWQYYDSGNVQWEFDFSPLCRGQGADDYVISDSSNHTFNFNMCGLAHEQCLPAWSNTFQFGAAVQMWGDTPPCNLTGTPDQYCLEPDSQQRVCCTKPCQVLGTGEPLFKPIDPTNPLFGGVSITYTGVPPSHDDPFTCPYNSKTGNQADRTVTFHVLCDPDIPKGGLIPVSVVENATSPCHYIITAKSDAACGCAPDCINRNCGDDGCDGFCGTLPGGGCPYNYNCDSNQICCKPDCTNRECGMDGCGGFCGNYNGSCPSDRPLCLSDQKCTYGYPSPSPDHYVKTAGGAIAGAFFGGVFGAVAIGAIGLFVYKRQRGSYSWGS